MVSFILRKKRSDSLLPNTPVGDTFFELILVLVEWWGEVQGYVCKQEWLLFFAWAQSLGWEDPLEEEMATCSSILAWVIPWREEHGGLTVHEVTEKSDTT